LGVPAAANAGGIAGAQYFAGNGNVQPRIERCAALNTAIAGADTGTGAAFNVYRIAGAGADSQPEWAQNSAYSGMTLTQDGAPVNASDKTASGKGGEDCAEQPAQSAYAGWDFVLGGGAPRRVTGVAALPRWGGGGGFIYQKMINNLLYIKARGSMFANGAGTSLLVK
ncbi:MAG: hypothetical protein LBG74_05985, partial [Spirochaetaceae bacterium]|nr:hypothetical protein [Spirochaetaceae bacterium]